MKFNFWNAPNGSGEFWIKAGIAFILGVLVMVGMTKMPPRGRRATVWTVTFFAGLFYVLIFLWPQPVKREPGTLPRDFVESVGFWLQDGSGVADKFSNTLTAFLLGLGVYSILRIHLGKLLRRQRDWQFSVVLLVSMLLMVTFGYIDYYQRHLPTGSQLDLQVNWGVSNYMSDLLFDGMLQQMDAAMFSVIAFYILSAAYRAFRARSMEATILLATALILMLSLLGAFEHVWNAGIDGIAGHDPNSFALNFHIAEIAKWLRDTFQTSSLRGISFGIGVGALAMGLRLWLGLERGGMNS